MRRERDWSAQQAHEALHDGLGLAAKSRAAYVAIEDGRPLRPREDAFLREFFGGGPTDEDRDPMEKADRGRENPVGLSDLLARLEAQEQAITRLARAIELLVGETRDDFAGAVEAVAALEEQEAGTPSTRRSDDPPAAAEAPRTGSPGTGSSGPPRPGTPHPSAR